MSETHPHDPGTSAADDATGAACSLSPIELTRRRVDLGNVLRHALSVGESERGLVLRFPATDAAARSVCDAVLLERQCCAQFHYVISFPAGTDTFTLSIDAAGPLVRQLKTLYSNLVPKTDAPE
jgi:hypothetical protein